VSPGRGSKTGGWRQQNRSRCAGGPRERRRWQRETHPGGASPEKKRAWACRVLEGKSVKREAGTAYRGKGIKGGEWGDVIHPTEAKKKG